MARVPLCIGGSTPCQGGRCQFIPPPDMEGYLPVTPPMFGLANPDQVLSVVVYILGFTICWHLQAASHSLGQMHMFLLTSTATSCYLRSSPIFSGCSSIIHSRSCNFPLIHPRKVLMAGHWVTALPLLSCGIIISSLPLEVGLNGVGLVHLSHA